MRLKVDDMSSSLRYLYWLDLLVDDNVLELLSSTPYIDYSNNTITLPSRKQRQSENSTSAGVEPEQLNTNRSLPSSPAISRTKIFATWGARSIENAGPLKTLRLLMDTNMQPYRPESVLHIGLTDVHSHELQMKKWGDMSGSAGLLYMQWCAFPPDALEIIYGYHDLQTPSEEEATCGISAETIKARNSLYFSDHCETKWFGNFS